MQFLLPVGLLRLSLCLLALLKLGPATQSVRMHIAAVQCLTAHVDILTSSQLAEVSPEFAKYVQTTLLQALEQTVPLHDSEQQKAQVRRRTLFDQS